MGTREKHNILQREMKADWRKLPPERAFPSLSRRNVFPCFQRFSCSVVVGECSWWKWGDTARRERSASCAWCTNWGLFWYPDFVLSPLYVLSGKYFSLPGRQSFSSRKLFFPFALFIRAFTFMERKAFISCMFENFNGNFVFNAMGKASE